MGVLSGLARAGSGCVVGHGHIFRGSALLDQTFDDGLKLLRADECLRREIVKEGESLDELLKTNEGPGISKAVDGLHVRGDTREELGDFSEARLELALDVFGKVPIDLTNASYQSVSSPACVDF